MASEKRIVAATYIWLDGTTTAWKAPDWGTPRDVLTPQLRSKMLFFETDGVPTKIEDVPAWGFDGSSTFQEKTQPSDLALKPVAFVPDPVGDGDILVLNETYYPNKDIHPTNTRRHLRHAAQRYANEEVWMTDEQEYTLFGKKNRPCDTSAQEGIPLGWPEDGKEPEAQGYYYCGVGFGRVAGRPLVNAHWRACHKAGIRITGINAEVMLGQWEFQCGPGDPLVIADQLWIARWLLHRLGEDHEIMVSFHPKPKSGDWNGAGGHVHFSTKAMREQGGLKVAHAAAEKLGNFHGAHIEVYGVLNELRLTGKHETCAIDKFRVGELDRGASIRLPAAAVFEGKARLEDRRPAANADPYLVHTALLHSVCGDGFSRTILEGGS